MAGVQIELVVANMRIGGTLALDETCRVSDLMNTPDPTLPLHDVSITALEGTRIETYPELTVEKRNVLAAIPMESEEHLTLQRRARFGVAHPDFTSVAVGLVLPPFHGQGVLSLSGPVNIGALGARLTPFFPLTSATLYLNRLPVVDDAVLLISREHLAGLGPLEDESPQPRPTGVVEQAGAAGDRDLIDRLMRELDAGAGEPTSN